jgi:hypothetical protein
VSLPLKGLTIYFGHKVVAQLIVTKDEVEEILKSIEEGRIYKVNFGEDQILINSEFVQLAKTFDTGYTTRSFCIFEH